jgi:hypothetical protein
MLFSQDIHEWRFTCTLMMMQNPDHLIIRFKIQILQQWIVHGNKCKLQPKWKFNHIFLKSRSKGVSSCWDFLDSSQRKPQMEIPWWFRIAVWFAQWSASRFFSALAGAYGCWIGQETWNRALMWSAAKLLPRKLRNTDFSFTAWERRGHTEIVIPYLHGRIFFGLCLGFKHI